MKKKVLFVDDEEEIRNSIRRLLRKESYEVFFSSTAEKALTILEQNPINLVITDQKMPGLSGVEFLGIVKERWPDVIRLLISGYIESDLLISAINKGEIYRFISKPWENDELKQFISEGLQHHEVLEENRKLMHRIINSGFFQSYDKSERGAVLNQHNSFVEELDYGLIVLDKQMIIKKTNKILSNILDTTDTMVGKNIKEILKPEIADFIAKGLDNNDGQAAEKHIINGKKLTIRIRSFRRLDDSEKGLVIIHE